MPTSRDTPSLAAAIVVGLIVTTAVALIVVRGGGRRWSSASQRQWIRRKERGTHYVDREDLLDTPRKILKLNHAGEFGAICIYRAQIMRGKLFRRTYIPTVESFLAGEQPISPFLGRNSTASGY